MKPALETRFLSKRYLRDVTSDHLSGMRTVGRSLRRLLSGNARMAEDTERWALKKVSIQIAPGEVVGLVGRPESGKSTLIKLLARVTEPTTGRVIIRGRTGALPGYWDDQDAMVTGRDYVFLNGACFGMTRAEIGRRIDAIVAFADIKALVLDTPIRLASQRVRLRLAFSITTHMDLDTMLIDELGRGDDTAFQRRCLERIKTLAGEGRTIVFASHDLDYVRSVCSRTIWFERGRVAMMGDTKDVLESYTPS